MEYNDKTDGDSLDGILDAGGGGSGCGYANAYNSIDAGYQHGVDLSQASNSSSFHGGIATNGYTQYSTTEANRVPGKSKRFTPDQQAVIALAKEYQNGISSKDAMTLVNWANEYGIASHSPMTHENRSGYWSSIVHIKIYKYHIEVVE